jgi:hypothetical protein
METGLFIAIIGLIGAIATWVGAQSRVANAQAEVIKMQVKLREHDSAFHAAAQNQAAFEVRTQESMEKVSQESLIRVNELEKRLEATLAELNRSMLREDAAVKKIAENSLDLRIAQRQIDKLLDKLQEMTTVALHE